MKTFYWLEIWADPKYYHRVCEIMGLLPESKPRSIIKIQPLEVEDEPQWYEIDSFLDLLETKYDDLEAVGVERKDISIWINVSHEEESCEFFLDPLTVLRLGEEGIKPCITCWQGDEWGLGAMFEDQNISERVVNIEGLWLGEKHQDDGPSYQELTVQFDDHSYWYARLVTYKDVFEWRKEGGDVKAGWQPGMILMESINSEEIEQLVVDLLRQRRFELAFRRLIGDSSQDSPPTDEVSLMLMHEAQLTNDLGHVLGLHEGVALQKRHFWTYRQQRYSGQPYVDYMSYYLDILEGKYPDLAGMGIGRKDIMLEWLHRYEGRCHMEFRPDVLGRLGKNGIGLSLTFMPIRPEVARSLE